MAKSRDRLSIKVFRLFEGEAEGPLAIVMLIAIIAIAAFLWKFG